MGQNKVKRLAATYGDRCYWCGFEMKLLTPLKYPRGKSGLFATIEHLVPESRGGTRRTDNIRLAHKSCNSRRGIDPDNDETKEKLRRYFIERYCNPDELGINVFQIDESRRPIDD